MNRLAHALGAIVVLPAMLAQCVALKPSNYLPLMQCNLIPPCKDVSDFEDSVVAWDFRKSGDDLRPTARPKLSHDEALELAHAWTMAHFQLPPNLSLRRRPDWDPLEQGWNSTSERIWLDQVWDEIPTERGVFIVIRGGTVVSARSSLATMTPIEGTEAELLSREEAINLAHTQLAGWDLTNVDRLELVYQRQYLTEDCIRRGVQRSDSPEAWDALMIPTWIARLAEGRLEIDAATGSIGIIR